MSLGEVAWSALVTGTTVDVTNRTVNSVISSLWPDVDEDTKAAVRWEVMDRTLSTILGLRPMIFLRVLDSILTEQ